MNDLEGAFNKSNLPDKVNKDEILEILLNMRMKKYEIS